VTCSSPLHQGDRLVRGEPGLERRIEYRRTTDQGRERVRMTGLVCRACMFAELRETPREQGALL